MKITFKNIENIYKLLTTTDWINSELTLESAKISIDEAKILLANIHLLHDKEYNEESREQLRKLIEDNFDELNSYEIAESLNDKQFQSKNNSLPLENLNMKLYQEVLPYSKLLFKIFGIDEVVLTNKLVTSFSDIE